MDLATCPAGCEGRAVDVSEAAVDGPSGPRPTGSHRRCASARRRYRSPVQNSCWNAVERMKLATRSEVLVIA
jgi:hypothetical protein